MRIRASKWVIAAAVLAFTVGLSANAHAALLTGGYSISGNVIFEKFSGATATNLTQAVKADFTTTSGTKTPGVAGPFVVDSTSGDFNAIAGQTGLVKDFTFSGPASPGFPTAPVLLFETVGGLTFDLLTVGISFVSSTSLVLEGTGLFHMAGFEDTPGTFTFTGNSGGGTFSFSASHAGAAVPEPASMLLFGVALFGVGAVARRRRRLT